MIHKPVVDFETVSGENLGRDPSFERISGWKQIAPTLGREFQKELPARRLQVPPFPVL
jgi:hypothetical protein